MRRAVVIALMLVSMPVLAWEVVEADRPYVHRSVGYQVQFPTGWKFARLREGNERGATRDGPLLQTIYVDFRRHGTAFHAIGKSSRVDMALPDIAADLLADVTRSRGLEGVQLISIESAELAGRPAFTLQFEYVEPVYDPDGAPLASVDTIRYREVIIGAVDQRGLYLVGYRAPLLYYFARDLGEFALVVRSFAMRD
jgi:hypothetical protein